MLFCTASIIQKNDTRCDVQTSVLQTSVFLSPNNFFLHNTFVACSLHSALTKAREETLVEKREEAKHFPCTVFPSSPTGKPIECQQDILPSQEEM